MQENATHLQVSLMASVLPGPLAADDGEGSDGLKKLSRRRMIVARDLVSPRRLSGYLMILCMESGRAEMNASMAWLQEELEGLNAQARELEATIAANVAGILES